jgi:hypothetical protein
MRDRGQTAVRDIVIRSSNALGAETDAFCDPREGKKIRATAVKGCLFDEIVISDWATVIGRDGGERCRPAVIAQALADQREILRRRATNQPGASIHCDDLERALVTEFVQANNDVVFSPSRNPFESTQDRPAAH